jgi:hypothetical protein
MSGIRIEELDKMIRSHKRTTRLAQGECWIAERARARGKLQWFHSPDNSDD